METLTIKIRNPQAKNLIQDLELLELIQIVHERPESGLKLSEIMTGSIDENQADTYHKVVKGLKGEWEKNT